MYIFDIIKEYFSHLTCEYCKINFDPKDIELLQENENFWVVSINCSVCQKTVGIAVIGIENGNKISSKIERIAHGNRETDLTESEKEKFDQLPPISHDEILNFHNFLKCAGTDWHKYLNSKH